MESTYDVVWPRSAQGVQAHQFVERLDSLEGKRVALLWDYVFRGDELFPVLDSELRSRFKGLEVVGYQEFGNTHGADEVEMIAGLAGELAARDIDAVVSGMGC